MFKRRSQSFGTRSRGVGSALPCTVPPNDVDRQMPDLPRGTDAFASVDSGKALEMLLRSMGQLTPSYASGVLLVNDRRGKIALLRSRPVDDLFLQALQQRLVLSYQLCAGSVLAEPEIDLTVYGDPIAGPYEPARSLLTVPMLFHGRIVGMTIIASIFPDAFCNEDLCVLSTLAAQSSNVLHCTGERTRDEQDCSCEGTPSCSRDELFAQKMLHGQVGTYLSSISGLARQWQDHGEEDLPETLCRDLETIAQNATFVRKLLMR